MASKDSNGLVISLSIFVLLTIGLGVAWYMTWAYSADVQRQLATAQAEKTAAEGNLRTTLDERKALLDLIGNSGETDEVVVAVKAEIAKRASDGSSSALPLQTAMIKTATDRDVSTVAATERQVLLEAKAAELAAANQKHIETMKSLQTQVAEKEEELRKKEALHGEQLNALNKQIDDLGKEKNDAENKYTTLDTQTKRQIEVLELDIREKREALIVLTQKAQELEDLSFEREDGRLVFVDQSSLTGSIDLGSRDELRVGTTFSVYKKNNSGVGRRSTEDIKGKIEVIKITGDHSAVVRIVDQLDGNPLAKEDPIYSPIFSSGQKLEVAVAGLLDFDGNPGGDRDEFTRLITGANAHIAVQISDEAKLVDQDKNELAEADPIGTLMNEKTRFLIIGDLGESNQTQDTVKQALYQKMQQHAAGMRKAALNNGIRVVSLSSFLEYIGYSRKNIAFLDGNVFPGILNNGALSKTITSSPRRASSTSGVSGLYANPKRQPAASNGATSALFKNSNSEN
jgi:hypothetical protein